MAIQTYEMILTGNCCNQFVQNVLHFFFDDVSYNNPLSSAKALVDGWIAADYHEEWLALHCQSYTLMSIKTRRRTGGVGPQWIDVSLGAQPGLRTGNSQSSSNGPVVLWLPQSPNRVTGKSFISGISDSDIDRGEISSAAIASMVDAASALIQEFPLVGGGTPDAQQCIVKSGAPGTRYAIDAVEICKEVGVQRRRQLPV